MRTRSDGVVVVVMVAALFACCLPVGACLECTTEGPYTTAFNHRMKAKGEAAGLVGRPEADVEVVLGRASNVWSSGPGWRTFDYYPYPLLPMAKFQVHCQSGVVAGLEMFDD